MICPNCHAHVSAPFRFCPLCQNELYEDQETLKLLADEDTIAHMKSDYSEGEEQPDEEAVLKKKPEEIPYYPLSRGVKMMSLADKIQMFAIFAVCMLSLALDYQFGLHGAVHWSMLVFIWGAVAELIIRPVMHGVLRATSYMSHCAVIVAMGLFGTAWYLHFIPICLYYLIPSIILAVLCANTVFCIIQRKGEVLLYEIANAVVGIVVNLVMFLICGFVPLMWNICLLMCILSIVGFAIFFGGQVKSELHKRLNL